MLIRPSFRGLVNLPSFTPLYQLDGEIGKRLLGFFEDRQMFTASAKSIGNKRARVDL